MVLDIDRYAPKKKKNQIYRRIKYSWLKFIRGMKYQPLIKEEYSDEQKSADIWDVLGVLIVIGIIYLIITAPRYVLPNLALLWAVCWKFMLLLLFIIIIGITKNEC